VYGNCTLSYKPTQIGTSPVYEFSVLAFRWKRKPNLKWIEPVEAMMALEAFVQRYNILLELNVLFPNLYPWNVLTPKHDTLLAIDPACSVDKWRLGYKFLKNKKRLYVVNDVSCKRAKS
jgi:hypothetical protein